MDKELVLYSNNEFYEYVLHYICSEENLSKKVKSFCYLEESNLRSYEYKPRFRKGDNKEKKVKICSLEDTSFSFDFNALSAKTLLKSLGITFLNFGNCFAQSPKIS